MLGFSTTLRTQMKNTDAKTKRKTQTIYVVQHSEIKGVRRIEKQKPVEL